MTKAFLDEIAELVAKRRLVLDRLMAYREEKKAEIEEKKAEINALELAFRLVFEAQGSGRPVSQQNALAEAQKRIAELEIELGTQAEDAERLATALGEIVWQAKEGERISEGEGDLNLFSDIGGIARAALAAHKEVSPAVDRPKYAKRARELTIDNEAGEVDRKIGEVNG